MALKHGWPCAYDKNWLCLGLTLYCLRGSLSTNNRLTFGSNRVAQIMGWIMDSKGQHRESRQSLGLLASCKLQVPSSCEGLERFKRVLSKSLVIFELFGEHFRTDLENLLSWKFYAPEQTGTPLTLRTVEDPASVTTGKFSRSQKRPKKQLLKSREACES